MTTTEQLERSGREVDAEGGAHYDDVILAFSQGIASATDRAAVLQETAKTIAGALEAPLYTFSEVVDGRQLQRTVGGDQDATSSCSLDPMASADAYALAEGAPITVDDLVTETRFRDGELRGFGVLSGICVHLSCGTYGDCCVGAYARERQVVSEGVVVLAKIVASMAASALGRIAAEERLDEVQSLASAMLDSSSSMVLVLDDQMRIERMNAACQRVVEFTLDEVKGRPMSSVLVVPEEYDKVTSQFRKAKNASEPIEFDSQILTKRGERRKVHWSLSAARQGGGDTSLVMTGTCPNDTQASAQRGESNVDRPADTSGQPSASSATDKTTDKTTHSVPDSLSIAPYIDNIAPAEGDYFKAPYREISAGGVTFQLTKKPDFDSLVIALGNPAHPTRLTAKVMRVQTLVQSGKVVYLVGCRFTGRLPSA
jgi:PAS domain S-box-containing protein